MTTMAILAWARASEGANADSTGISIIERHHGRLGRRLGVAYFPGASDALAAAVALQLLHPAAVVVTVAELDQPSDTDHSAAVTLTRRLVEHCAPGTILGTDIVRLLLPEPNAVRWSDEPAPGPGFGGTAIHQLLWRPTEPETITVVVAEDTAIIRAGIISLLRTEGMTVLGDAADYESLLATVRATRPRLLITDVRMPPAHGDEGLRAASILRAEQADLSVLVLSQYVQASAAVDLLTRQTSGVGYLLKERVADLDEFLDAARTVARGGTVIDPMITEELLSRNRNVEHFQALADRERAVLELMAQGLSNAAIAERLNLSARTVESHVRSVMTKLDLWEDPAGNRRVQAVIRWLEQH